MKVILGAHGKRAVAFAVDGTPGTHTNFGACVAHAIGICGPQLVLRENGPAHLRHYLGNCCHLHTILLIDYRETKP